MEQGKRESIISEWNSVVDGSTVTTVLLVLGAISGGATAIVGIADKTASSASHILDWFTAVLAAGTGLFVIVSMLYAIYRLYCKERSRRIALETEMKANRPNFHATCDMVMPLRQTNQGLTILANIRVENRGADGAISNWDMWASIGGKIVKGVFDASVAGEDHIERNAEEAIPRGSMRNGAYTGFFPGIELSHISLHSIVLRFYDAFGREYETHPVKDEDVLPHFPIKRSLN